MFVTSEVKKQPRWVTSSGKEHVLQNEVASTRRTNNLPDSVSIQQRYLGNNYLQSGSRSSQIGVKNPFKKSSTEPTAGGISGLTLDVTFTVSNTTAAGLQAVQTFWGTRRSDGKQVGSMSWTENKKTYDAFVDGGKESPYVKWSGNSPAHPTEPYYLTPAEVASQVKFSKDSGSVRIYDAPGAAAVHDEANFETAIVAVNYNNSKKDKVLKVFDWGWSGKGTTPNVSPGTKIAGKNSGISVKSTPSTKFTNIVKHDYPKYTFS